MSYQPPHRRKQNQKSAKPAKPVQIAKLGDNEELLPDGRILIRGTLRKDGSRRPDRYKRAGFQNDEDMQRNKYMTKGAIQRKQQKDKEKINIINYVESLVINIINNPPKSFIYNKNLNINFNENVLKPLLNEFYNENKLLLIKDITKWFTKNINQCQELIDNDLLRIEIIKYIHKLYNNYNEKQEKHQKQKQLIRGKGNFSFGTGIMLSENIEIKRKKKQYDEKNIINHNKNKNKNKNNDKQRDRNKIRKLNEKYREIEKLEEQQSNGKILNDEQIANIHSKQDVLDKLEDLKISVGHPANMLLD